MRASSVDKDEENTRHLSEEPGHGRNTADERTAGSPTAPPALPAQRSPQMPGPPTQTGSQRDSVQRPGLESFDITSFNPTDPTCWKALADAFEVTNGYPPTQEDVQQIVATSMSMAMGMGISLGMGAGTTMSMGGTHDGAEATQSYMGPNDWPDTVYTANVQESTDRGQVQNIPQSPPSSAGGGASGSGGGMQKVGDKWVYVRNQA